MKTIGLELLVNSGEINQLINCDLHEKRQIFAKCTVQCRSKKVGSFILLEKTVKSFSSFSLLLLLYNIIFDNLKISNNQMQLIFDC